MPSVENPTEDTIVIPVGYGSNGKIPNYRNLKPGKILEVSEDALPTCIRMGCLDMSKVEDSPTEEDAPADNSEEAPAEEEKPRRIPSIKWSWNELREYAEAMGVEVDESDTKKILLDKIVAK